MDFGLCSPNLLFKFIGYLQDERKVHISLGYTDAISESIDFRKVKGSSEAVLRNLFTTELYFKNVHRTVAKMMRLQWTQDLDNSRSQGTLGNDGGIVTSGDLSLAMLRKYS